MSETHESLLLMFERYPIGTVVMLKSDYPHEVHTVVDYKSLDGEWYIVLNDDTRVCIGRIDELLFG